MTMKVAIGADPDTRTPAMAAVDLDTGNLVGVRVVSAPRTGTGSTAVAQCAVAMRGCFRDFLHGILDPYVEVIAIEGQVIYPKGHGRQSKARPADIITLAQVAGAMVAEAAHEVGPHPTKGAKRLLIPTPNQWKGEVPKQAHQASRVYGQLGWRCELIGSQQNGYARPTHPEDFKTVIGAVKLNPGDWKHVGDAIGIAQYAREQAISQRRKAKA